MVHVGDVHKVNVEIVVVSFQRVPVKEGTLYKYSVAIMGMGTGEVYSALSPEEVGGFGLVTSKHGLKLGALPVDVNSEGKSYDPYCDPDVEVLPVDVNSEGKGVKE